VVRRGRRALPSDGGVYIFLDGMVFLPSISGVGGICPPKAATKRGVSFLFVEFWFGSFVIEVKIALLTVRASRPQGGQVNQVKLSLISFCVVK